MSQIPPKRQDRRPDVETVLLDQFDWSIEVFQDLILKMASGKGVTEAERKRALARLRETLGQILKERSIVAERLRADVGGARDGVDLDLEEARAEIGRRLDRIRLAQDAEGLS